ncbi:hypothetical protein DAMA08_032540 [Martiniozyma asiatica (nom. inval.)]|nr:hypothetical protein DAMA08_032540 [Martiniozyma asiatica]
MNILRITAGIVLAFMIFLSIYMGLPFILNNADAAPINKAEGRWTIVGFHQTNALIIATSSIASFTVIYSANVEIYRYIGSLILAVLSSVIAIVVFKKGDAIPKKN